MNATQEKKKNLIQRLYGAAKGGGPIPGSVMFVLVLVVIVVLCAFVFTGLYAFRGQQTGSDLTSVGMESARHGVYGFSGLHGSNVNIG